MPPPLTRPLERFLRASMLFLNSHRVIAYSFLSFLAVSLTIANALRNFSNFYSVAIYLSKSSRSVLVLANSGFLVALLCGHVIQKLFFGTLRPTEVERLYDRLWFFITESLLAFTIFRDEFDIPFALMFGFLLFVKSFHWLVGDRIEWMDQVPYPGPPLLFHIRMSTLFVILWLTDFIMFLIAVESTLVNGVGGMVLFASEYGILVASVMNTISKYLLSVYDLRRAGRRGGENAPPWENKSMWIFYIELATDFLKLTTYLIFFLIIIAFYGLPLNIVRDVYITARSFITRLRALHRYQTATRNMDQRYPNATEDELRSMNDRTCIICREEMVAHEPGQAAVREGPNITPKKLPCGHVFHFHCLRSWLERQQSCPTCRRTVLENHGVDRNTAPAQPQVPGPNPQQGNQGGVPVPPVNPVNAQRNNIAGRNPFGFIGRFFAPPVQAPAGAFPPVNVPGNPGAGANPANVAGQVPQEVLIQYHIQYQTQRQQLPQRPDHLQPVPQFQGFVRPGGAWQPWPARVQGNEQGREQDGVTEPDPAAGTTTNAEGVTPQLPTTARSGNNNEISTPQNPREAAALAALRRLGSGRPVAETPENNSGAGTSSTRPSNPVSSDRDTAALPGLIPLFDLNSLGTGQDNTGSNGHAGQAGTSTVGGSRDTVSGSRLQLDLTEEQLAVMDRVTREAIDERLRILEGVSVRVYQCIDDLMRMRSALPSPSASTVGPDTIQTDEDVRAGHASDVGKTSPGTNGAGPSTVGNHDIARGETDDVGCNDGDRSDTVDLNAGHEVEQTGV
ncbi:hypothetical protein AX17_005783 [Amanita inopinata Kibby_2008]|nr:hypothetical protein AX17_005783 [Amanita inopinata Kibby_2008]